MQTSHSIVTRLGVLAVLLFIELMLISVNFDAFLPTLKDDTSWFSFLAYAGQFAKFGVTVLTALSLALWARLAEHFKHLQTVLATYKFHYFSFLQLLAYCLFYWNTALVFGERPDQSTQPDILIISWLILLVSVAGLWLLSIAPWHYWKKFINAEKTAISLSLLVGVFAWCLALLSQEIWKPLSALTFHTSSFLLGLLYPDIIVNLELKLLGTQNFFVNIAPACSGYEGIGLVTIFTLFYLSIFKKEFRFPQALLLFPIGIVTIWFFNALRIAALIAIGDSFSEEVAVGGFHSQAGWISFIIVTLGILIAAHKIPFFCKQPIAHHSSHTPMSLAMALLIPFIVLLTSTILSSALSAEFHWYYPARVIATAIALTYCWKYFSFSKIKINLEPIIIGIAVFVFWILLIPNDIEQNTAFAKELFEAPQSISTSWLVLRFIGAVITVPLVEELLFRGYLLCRLANINISLEGRLPISWLALLGSSILFGLLHSTWIAGTLAGLAYGLVRYRSNSVMDAVIAHGVTNLCISVLVLCTGYWSLW